MNFNINKVPEEPCITEARIYLENDYMDDGPLEKLADYLLDEDFTERIARIYTGEPKKIKAEIAKLLMPKIISVRLRSMAHLQREHDYDLNPISVDSISKRLIHYLNWIPEQDRGVNEITEPAFLLFTEIAPEVLAYPCVYVSVSTSGVTTRTEIATPMNLIKKALEYTFKSCLDETLPGTTAVNVLSIGTNGNLFDDYFGGKDGLVDTWVRQYIRKHWDTLKLKKKILKILAIRNPMILAKLEYKELFFKIFGNPGGSRSMLSDDGHETFLKIEENFNTRGRPSFSRYSMNNWLDASVLDNSNVKRNRFSDEDEEEVSRKKKVKIEQSSMNLLMQFRRRN